MGREKAAEDDDSRHAGTDSGAVGLLQPGLRTARSLQSAGVFRQSALGTPQHSTPSCTGGRIPFYCSLWHSMSGFR